MLINGEKYACEACVRGHRVSSCTHSERKLLHVNKKGRPVSQCPHCRSLRKNRATHIKCECHDKSHAKEDCPHLKDLQAEAQSNNNSASPNTCCCGHGARCTCGLKKETHLESVPEDFTHILQQSKNLINARATGPNVNQHDSKPIVFTNGHHKPVHKFNDAHNHCGAPYRIPSRSNSQHGHRENMARSTDHLPLPGRATVHHESPLHNVLSASNAMRQVRSEHNSPMLVPASNSNLPSFPVEIPPLSPNAYSFSPFDSNSPANQHQQPMPHLPDNIPDNWFTTHEDAHSYGPPAVPELAYIDWSKYGFGATPTSSLDSTPNMKTLYSSLANNQVPSYVTSMEHLNNEGATSGFNTSSGDVSDVEELPGNLRPSVMRSTSHASNDHSSTGATDDDQSHRLSSASSYFGTPAGNMLANNLEDLDIDRFISEHTQANKPPQNPFSIFSPQSNAAELKQQMQQQNFPQQRQVTPVQQPTPPQSQYTTSTPPESVRGYSIASHNSPTDTAEPQIPYSIREAQARAHLSNEESNKQNLQTNMFANDTFVDPMWFQPELDQTGINRGFRLDDEREDEQWAR